MFGTLGQFVDFLAARPVLSGALLYALIYVPYRLRARRLRKLKGEAKIQALAVYEAQRPYAERMYDPFDENMAGAESALEPTPPGFLPTSKAA